MSSFWERAAHSVYFTFLIIRAGIMLLFRKFMVNAYLMLLKHNTCIHKLIVCC